MHGKQGHSPHWIIAANAIAHFRTLNTSSYSLDIKYMIHFYTKTIDYEKYSIDYHGNLMVLYLGSSCRSVFRITTRLRDKWKQIHAHINEAKKNYYTRRSDKKLNLILMAMTSNYTFILSSTWEQIERRLLCHHSNWSRHRIENVEN